MSNSQPASLGEATVLAQGASWPAILKPIDVYLQNGSTVTAIGDLMMIDTASTGVSTSSTGTKNVGDYFRVIAPTVAGNLAAAGQTHCVALEVIAAGASGWFRLYGDVNLNLATSSATVGSKIGTNGTARTGEVTTIVTLTKIIGLTKIATTAGVIRVFFNGFPPGMAIAA